MKYSTKGLALAYVVGVLFSGSAFAQDDKISLVCTGAGSKKANQTTVVRQWNRNSDDGRRTAYANTRVNQPFNGTAYVDIYGPLARVKLPSGMLPPIRGDDDGWFDIKGLSRNDREITGKVRINALNKPEITIDRMTGRIEIRSGFSNFSGQCDKYDRESSERRF